MPHNSHYGWKAKKCPTSGSSLFHYFLVDKKTLVVGIQHLAKIITGEFSALKIKHVGFRIFLSVSSCRKYFQEQLVKF